MTNEQLNSLHDAINRWAATQPGIDMTLEDLRGEEVPPEAVTHNAPLPTPTKEVWFKNDLPSVLKNTDTLTQKDTKDGA